MINAAGLHLWYVDVAGVDFHNLWITTVRKDRGEAIRKGITVARKKFRVKANDPEVTIRYEGTLDA